MHQTYKKAIAANAHATDPLTNGQADAIYCGGAGNLVCKTRDGATDVTVPVVAGGYFYVKTSHVRAIGTTATGIFALYL